MAVDQIDNRLIRVYNSTKKRETFFFPATRGSRAPFRNLPKVYNAVPSRDRGRVPKGRSQLDAEEL